MKSSFGRSWEELYGLYANAIRAERARYDALLANDLARSGAARRSPKRRAKKAAARPLPLPLGELSPKVTERASPPAEGGGA